MSVRSPLDDPLDRLRIELICLGRTLMPDKESFDRTIATLVLFGVWSVIVIAPMLFPRVESAPEWLMLGTTAIVWLVIGRMWGLEVDRVLNAVTNIRVTTDGGQPQEEEED